MTVYDHLVLNCRSQKLVQNSRGFNVWQRITTPLEIPANEVGVIVCDMWDQHWSRGASERVNRIAPVMNRVLKAVRSSGGHIIHAPSDVVNFYEGTPARQRILSVPSVELPPIQEHSDPPLPIDDSDEGSDTGETEAHRVWSRQHEALEIDQEKDVISDKGHEIYAYIRQQNITQLIIIGVHTNMCVLNRSFAIKQMVRWGQNIVLARDLTDAMYNPAMSPYVSHEAGTELVIEYIEKYWCPSIHSDDVF